MDARLRLALCHSGLAGHHQAPIYGRILACAIASIDEHLQHVSRHFFNSLQNRLVTAVSTASST